MRTTMVRAALVMMTGLLLSMAQPPGAGAAPAGDDTPVENADAGQPLALTKSKTPRSHKASRARKPAKIAAAKSTRRAAPAKATAGPAAQSAISETVANANAQMPAADVHGAAAAKDIPAAPLEAAAADQLTELDRALAAEPAEEPRQIAQLSEALPSPAAPAATVGLAPSQQPTQTPVTQAKATAATDAWAQSSLIGKIFIAFGGMLTLASAARMLIA